MKGYLQGDPFSHKGPEPHRGRADIYPKAFLKMSTNWDYPMEFLFYGRVFEGGGEERAWCGRARVRYDGRVGRRGEKCGGGGRVNPCQCRECGGAVLRWDAWG